MKKKVIITMICASMLAQTGAFAMSTREFDKGMEKGINYFDQGLYYEAKDEFTWFRDYNKHNMNSGQLKYLEDYLQGAWNRIYAWEAYVKNKKISEEQAINIVKNDLILGGFFDSYDEIYIKSYGYNESLKKYVYAVFVENTRMYEYGITREDDSYTEWSSVYYVDSNTGEIIMNVG